MSKKVYNIIIAGVGGQGTLLTSRILGDLALQAGHEVKLSEVHGMAQRGGSVVTYVRFGQKIQKPTVEPGEADLLIAFERLEALRYVDHLAADGLLVLNDERIDPMPVVLGRKEYPEEEIRQLAQEHQLVIMPAQRLAKELGNRRVFNVIILGAASTILPFTVAEWQAAIRRQVPEKTIEINLEAFALGRSYAEENLKDTDIETVQV